MVHFVRHSPSFTSNYLSYAFIPSSLLTNVCLLRVPFSVFAWHVAPSLVLFYFFIFIFGLGLGYYLTSFFIYYFYPSSVHITLKSSRYSNDMTCLWWCPARSPSGIPSFCRDSFFFSLLFSFTVYNVGKLGFVRYREMYWGSGSTSNSWNRYVGRIEILGREEGRWDDGDRIYA